MTNKTEQEMALALARHEYPHYEVFVMENARVWVEDMAEYPEHAEEYKLNHDTTSRLWEKYAEQVLHHEYDRINKVGGYAEPPMESDLSAFCKCFNASKTPLSRATAIFQMLVDKGEIDE